jgi:hypothetical protein
MTVLVSYGSRLGASGGFRQLSWYDLEHPEHETMGLKLVALLFSHIRQADLPEEADLEGRLGRGTWRLPGV